jgi:hypothetical protein
MVGIVINQINSTPCSSIFEASANAGKGPEMKGNFLWRQTFRHRGHEGGCGVFNIMQPRNSQPDFGNRSATMEDFKNLRRERRPSFCGRRAGGIHRQISDHPVGRCISSKTEDNATGFTRHVE